MAVLRSSETSCIAGSQRPVVEFARVGVGGSDRQVCCVVALMRPRLAKRALRQAERCCGDERTQVRHGYADRLTCATKSDFQPRTGRLKSRETLSARPRLCKKRAIAVRPLLTIAWATNERWRVEARDRGRRTAISPDTAGANHDSCARRRG